MQFNDYMLVGLKIINMKIKELFLGLRYSLAPMGNYGVSAFSKLSIVDTPTSLPKQSNKHSLAPPHSVPVQMSN